MLFDMTRLLFRAIAEAAWYQTSALLMIYLFRFDIRAGNFAIWTSLSLWPRACLRLFIDMMVRLGSHISPGARAMLIDYNSADCYTGPAVQRYSSSSLYTKEMNY